MSMTEPAKLEVRLESRTYPIWIGHGLDDRLSEVLATFKEQKRPLAVITDAWVAKCQSVWMERHFHGIPRFEIPPGESSKNLQLFAEALEFLAGSSLDRSTVMLAVGGGVVGDFAGYVAASYMRGLEFIQIPTTLLAMVDSSVGGKTGVNLKAGKNLVGAFHQPLMVFSDLSLLGTLDGRQFAAGMAEVIKAALLADAELWDQLESLPALHAASPALVGVIERACAIKARVVAADERETAANDGRALLNLGHTFGHAIEQCTGYTKYLHGEAVSIGIVMAANLSRELGYLNARECERIEAVLSRYHLPVRLDGSVTAASLVTAMGRDKKKTQGSLRYVVLKSLGIAATQRDLPAELVQRALLSGGAL
jgi:3-dehydroquinate synthase